MNNSIPSKFIGSVPDFKPVLARFVLLPVPGDNTHIVEDYDNTHDGEITNICVDTYGIGYNAK